MKFLILQILLIAFLVTQLTEATKDNADLSVIPLPYKAGNQPEIPVKHRGNSIKRSKSKRYALRRAWSKSGYNPPPYLVYNRKLGAYYPSQIFPDVLRRKIGNAKERGGYRTINTE